MPDLGNVEINWACLVWEHSLSEIALSSYGPDLNEVSGFKVNYVERYDSGARICNDHLGPHSLEASYRLL